MSAERLPEDIYSPHPFDDPDHEIGLEIGVGERVYPIKMDDALEVLSDPQSISKHPKLEKVLDSFSDAGQEVWGQLNAHRGGIVLTAVGIVGVAGIGIIMRRRNNEENSAENT